MVKTAKLRRDGMIRVTFTLPTGEPAGPVSVVGDFNGWDPLAHPLRRRANRTRSASVTVPAGSTFRFRYLADGGLAGPALRLPILSSRCAPAVLTGRSVTGR
jgi:1,4-alpha-glucan branching enzyme